MLLCPFDSTELKVVNRSGIEIDWCPACKGVWLERGELDKLIDQVAGSGSGSGPASADPGFVPPAPAGSEPAYIPPGPQHQAPPPPPQHYTPPPQPQHYSPPPGPGPGPGQMAGYGHPGDYRPPRQRGWDSSSGSWDSRRGGGSRRSKRKHLLKEIFDF